MRSLFGYTLLAAGAALLVLPGPGIPLVLGGLALLAKDRPWARRGFDRVKLHVERLRAGVRERKASAP
ncbi:MAG: PGPGW domain-containing protein [Anaeromyxobacter sp.]